VQGHRAVALTTSGNRKSIEAHSGATVRTQNEPNLNPKRLKAWRWAHPTFVILFAERLRRNNGTEGSEGSQSSCKNRDSSLRYRYIQNDICKTGMPPWRLKTTDGRAHSLIFWLSLAPVLPLLGIFARLRARNQDHYGDDRSAPGGATSTPIQSRYPPGHISQPSAAQRRSSMLFHIPYGLFRMGNIPHSV
jgi:hypothetical protein